jgi:outer membrane murein-binding lipoprotein Lpp
MVRNQRDEGRSVYTQTYSTADRTVANATVSALGDLVATNGGWGANSEVNFDKIATAVDALAADVLQLKKVVSALVDDLQEAGVVK